MARARERDICLFASFACLHVCACFGLCVVRSHHSSVPGLYVWFAINFILQIVGCLSTFLLFFLSFIFSFSLLLLFSACFFLSFVMLLLRFLFLLLLSLPSPSTLSSSPLDESWWGSLVIYWKIGPLLHANAQTLAACQKHLRLMIWASQSDMTNLPDLSFGT